MYISYVKAWSLFMMFSGTFASECWVSRILMNRQAECNISSHSGICPWTYHVYINLVQSLITLSWYLNGSRFYVLLCYNVFSIWILVMRQVKMVLVVVIAFCAWAWACHTSISFFFLSSSPLTGFFLFFIAGIQNCLASVWRLCDPAVMTNRMTNN